MHKTTWHSASAVSQMMPGDILVVRMLGPISDEALAYFRASKSAAYSQVRAVVVDYTAAMLAVSAEEMTGKVIEAEPGSFLLLPAALVVAPELFHSFSAHARRVAALGVMRRVFFSLAPALSWVAEEVARPGARVAAQAG